MSLPTQQLSQISKTKRHENFCLCFCGQVEKHHAKGDASNTSYQNQANKLFSQLEEETRWNNLCAFLASKVLTDKGELLSRFAKNWYISLEELLVENKSLHSTRMLHFIMDTFQAEHLGSDSLFALHAVFSAQARFLVVEKLEPNDLEGLCAYISERLLQGKAVPNKWIGMGHIILRRVGNINDACFSIKDKKVCGMSFRRQFLLQCLAEVITTDSIRALASLARECDLMCVIAEFVSSCLEGKSDHQLCAKLIVLLPEIPVELAEQACEYVLREVNFSLSDLLPLCVLFHSVLSSNAIISRAVFMILKREKHLLTSRVFPLLCLLSLSNTPRMHSNALSEIKQNIVKLWKHSGKLEESEWIRDAVGECDLAIMERNLGEIVDAVTRNQDWNSVIGNAIRDLAFLLLTEKNNNSVKINRGRIDDDSGLFSLGKRLLVAVAQSNPSCVGALLDQVFLSLSVCSNHFSSLCLIDVVVDIVSRHTLQVLNSWKSLRHLVDTVCSLKEDLGVSLVRALLPVIVQRSELVSAIVSQMKKHVLCETTVTTALPILLLLLRSSVVRAAVRDDQFSQSFATFSTQTLNAMGISVSSKTDVALEITSILNRTLSQPVETKVLLYRGIVEACYANENLLEPSLELLLTHFSSLPTISRETYVATTKTSTVLHEPLPQLVQTTSILIRLSIHASRNSSTQIVNKRDLQIDRAVTNLQHIIDFSIDRDIHDLEIDKLSDFSPSAAGRANFLFSSMLIGLYDTLIEHLWHVGNVLVSIEAAEKITSLLRRKDELNDVLKEKMAKKKEGKSAKQSGTTPILLQVGTVNSILSAFIENKVDEDFEVNEGCLRLLRLEAFTWLMEWSERVASNLQSYVPQPSLLSLTTFARLNMILATIQDNISNASETYLWDGKCSQAANAFCLTLLHIVSKYGLKAKTAFQTLWDSICKEEKHRGATGITAIILLVRFFLCTHVPKLLEAYQDFDERKVVSDFTRQVISYLSVARSLTSLLPNNDSKLMANCFKFSANLLRKFQIEEKSVLKETWKYLIYTARRGLCDELYTDMLTTASTQIIDLLKRDEISTQLQSICDDSVEVNAEMIIDACVASFSDIRLVIEIVSQPTAHSCLDTNLTKALSFSRRLAEVVKILLPVHIEYALLKERVCGLLTALYSTLNSIVKLLLFYQKTTDLTNWKSVVDLATLARGSVLKIMEAADENVGTLNPVEEVNMKQLRKYAKSLKEETLYVGYVRAREMYQANLLLLSAALQDKRLDVQVKNNSIGVRDFRIDAEKLRQRMARMEDEDSEGNEENTPPPPKKRPKTGLRS